jgi:hypothetical protein
MNTVPFFVRFGILALVIGLTALARAEVADRVQLFDGQTLDGWVNHGGGKFFAEDGAIVGETAVGLPNSFLATAATFDDFVLELEFWVDPMLNSGVQIRSNVREAEATTERFTGRYNVHGTPITHRPTWPKGRFWGYQIEIDPTERGWTACVYEEAGRGFLHPPGTVDVNKVFDFGGWNHFRIEVNGGRIRTWLNRMPVADVYDTLTSEGYIGLQLHGIKDDKTKAGKRVMWRNLVLKPIP